MKQILAAALIISLLPAPVLAEPTMHVIGVAANDMLNLRAGPDAKAAKTGALGPDATGISVVAVDSKSIDWVKVVKGAIAGWVNAKYLAYENGMPARLACIGTEPFWAIQTGYGNALFDFSAMGGGKTRSGFGEPIAAAARQHPWLVTFDDKGSSFLLIDERACSDGMSDNNYPYAIAASVRGHFVEGCCL